MNTILVVEDSLDFQLLVKKSLPHHRIIIVDDPDLVLPTLEVERVDLILLGISLPKRDGYTVLDELQSHPEFYSLPVICLTGKTEVTDKITAFSLGADDYISKPFNTLELKARVDGRLNKLKKLKIKNETLQIGSLKLEISSHRVFDDKGTEIHLTQTEFKLLKAMSRHPDTIFSRENLLTSVWGDEGAVFDRAVDVHVCSLRKKIAASDVRIKSVQGMGYKITLQASAKAS